MATNVVTFRAERIVPRVTRSREADGEPATMSAAASVRASVRASVPSDSWAAIEDIDGQPGWLEDLADRIAAFRDRCDQLTFYMTDPESWR
jgi:hypothetical protein